MHEKRNKHRSSLEMRKAANQEGRGSVWCQVWAWLPRFWETNKPQKLVVGWAAQGPLGAGRSRPLLSQEDGPARLPAGVCPWRVAGALGAAASLPESNLVAPYHEPARESSVIIWNVLGFFKWPKSPKEQGERHNHRVSGFPISLLEDAELVVVEHVPPSPRIFILAEA